MMLCFRNGESANRASCMRRSITVTVLLTSLASVFRAS